jgi:DNA-binding MarR family transcriptional regulator
LAEFRYLIRCFLEFSQDAAREVGLNATHHQALLAIKGFPSGTQVTVGGLADRLRLRQHSVVELIDRLEEADLVVRQRDSSDRRRVLLGLTERAEKHLADLSITHLDELSRIGPLLTNALSRFTIKP